MRALALIAVAAALPARADRLSDLLFDYDTAQSFCRGLTRSVVAIAVTPRAEADAVALAVLPGFAVVVSVDGAKRLVTSGPLVLGAGAVSVRAPSGRIVALGAARALGDGALAELPLTDALLWAELQGLALAEADAVKVTVPVFAVGDPGSETPVLARGVIVERLDGPLDGVLVDDVALPFGAALITADGTLAGINYRPHPEKKQAALAVAAEKLLAWLRPESPTAAPPPPAP